MEYHDQIRILQVFGKLNRGGSESLIMEIYRGIDKSKLQFDFVVHSEEEGAFEKEVLSLGGKIYRIPRYKVKNHFAYKNAWHKLLSQNKLKWKAIHGHMYTTAPIYVKVAKAMGMKTIVHSHNTSFGKGLRAQVKKILQFSIKEHADYLFSCSNKAGEWLFGHNILNATNFYVLNNGIDPNKFVFNDESRDQKRKELNIEDNLVIGHVGRFHYQKNHTFLIDIFKAIHDKNKKAKLLLIGDGDHKPDIEKKVKHLGLSDDVIFAGVRSDVSDLLSAMDLMVFPSHYEGLGIALIEAQASGLKCFASADVIPEEAKITPLVEFIPLTQPAEVWASEILKNTNGNIRQDYIHAISENGYDIQTNSLWLQDFYLSLNN